MSCIELCCSGPSNIEMGRGEIRSNIVDLEKIVIERAKRVHEKGRRIWCISQCLQQEKTTLELDWSGVKFHPMIPVYTPVTVDDAIPATENVIVFSTSFENKSASPQEQTIKVERMTSATSTCSLTKGYSVGGSIQLTLKAPKAVVSGSCGFTKGIKIENAVQNQQQHSLTWSTDGKLTVGQHSKVTARLEVKEEQRNYTFECRVAVQGSVKGTFYDYNRKIVDVYTGSMRTILLDEIEDAEDATDIDDAAYMTIKGGCGFRFGVEQEIIIE